jgi:orotate phosphoribosyltransferase
MKRFVFSLCLFFVLSNQASIESLCEQLYQHNIIKRGSFTLKSGEKADIYIDIRAAISVPSLFRSLTDTIHLISLPIEYDRICGVPYGAIPFATALACKSEKPLLMLRKEVKNYGMQKRIDGDYNEKDCVLLIEDVMTTGESILETITLLQQNNLIIRDIIVLVDRQAGGKERLEALGYHVYSILTLADLQIYQSV